MFRPNFSRKHVSLSENAGIIVLSSAGISFREISAALDVSKSASLIGTNDYVKAGNSKGNRVPVGNQNLFVRLSVSSPTFLSHCFVCLTGKLQTLFDGIFQ
jgi:hypothetical protein